MLTLLGYVAPPLDCAVQLAVSGRAALHGSPLIGASIQPVPRAALFSDHDVAGFIDGLLETQIDAFRPQCMERRVVELVVEKSQVAL